MKSIFNLLLVATVICLWTSCKKKAECTAGTGGQVTIVAFPQHHGKSIPNRTNYPDTVYLKFNTQNSPGSSASAYDVSFVGEPGEDHIHCTGLKCGNYYIYAVGYDTTISQRVSGGIPYSFSQTTGEIDLNVPVTE